MCLYHKWIISLFWSAFVPSFLLLPSQSNRHKPDERRSECMEVLIVDLSDRLQSLHRAQSNKPNEQQLVLQPVFGGLFLPLVSHLRQHAGCPTLWRRLFQKARKEYQHGCEGLENQMKETATAFLGWVKINNSIFFFGWKCLNTLHIHCLYRICC